MGTPGRHPTTELHPGSQGEFSPQPHPSLVGSAEWVTAIDRYFCLHKMHKLNLSPSVMMSEGAALTSCYVHSFLMTGFPRDWDRCLYRKKQDQPSASLFFFQLLWARGEGSPCISVICRSLDIRSGILILGLPLSIAMRIHICYLSSPLPPFCDTL